MRKMLAEAARGARETFASFARLAAGGIREFVSGGSPPRLAAGQFLWLRFYVAALLDGCSRKLLELRVNRHAPSTAHLLALAGRQVQELNMASPELHKAATEPTTTTT
jgi:hypothetical protein